jgi:hypothetical protein
VGKANFAFGVLGCFMGFAIAMCASLLGIFFGQGSWQN